MPKRVVALADLDPLADSTALLLAFAEQPGARAAVERAMHDSVVDADKRLRSDFAQMVTCWRGEIEPLAAGHRYMREAHADLDCRKRRAGLAALLSGGKEALARLKHGAQWLRLRTRFEGLLSCLEAGGLFFVRRGTIEDCFLAAPAPGSAGRPEAAAAEAAAFEEAGDEDLRRAYAGPARAVDSAAPAPPVAEEALLRRLLAGLLAATFQSLTPATSDDEVARLAAASDASGAAIFRLENATGADGALALRVHIASPLFAGPGFPAEVTAQNLHADAAELFR